MQCYWDLWLSTDELQTARAVVEQEANSLADVFLLSETCRPPFNTEVRKLCSDYVNEVLDKEWEDMSRGRICPDARRDVVRLINKVKQYEPVTETEKQIIRYWCKKRSRSGIIAAPGLISQSYGVPSVEWFVLILGGIVTVVFTYFFGIESLKVQVMMTVMVSLLISLNLYLVILFGAPFSGDLQVSPLRRYM